MTPICHGLPNLQCCVGDCTTKPDCAQLEMILQMRSNFVLLTGGRCETGVCGPNVDVTESPAAILSPGYNGIRQYSDGKSNSASKRQKFATRKTSLPSWCWEVWTQETFRASKAIAGNILFVSLVVFRFELCMEDSCRRRPIRTHCVRRTIRFGM